MTENKISKNNPPNILLVTGVSGAGRSSALKVLEDIGYEAIDNVPLSLLSRLINTENSTENKNPPIAVGIDIRTRDFAADTFLKNLNALNALENTHVAMMFLDCDNSILVRRFEETRRRHPLAGEHPVLEGIRMERELLSPIRSRATHLIDTSELSLKDMKQVLNGHFGFEDIPRPTIFVTSFSFKQGLPRAADLVFDVRFLRNPYYETELKNLSGCDSRVAAYIEKDEAFTTFLEKLSGLLELLLGRYAAEGKSYLTIAFGCTGGRHRSVFLAETIYKSLKGQDWSAQIQHRDMDKWKS